MIKWQSPLSIVLLLVACLVIVFAVLNTSPFSTPTPHSALKLSEPVSIPVTTQRPGDPTKGKQLLLSGAYISCGLPLSAVQSAVDDRSVPRIEGRTGSGKDLPYFNNLIRNGDGVDVVTSNCLTCHASMFNNELVIGLGNEFLDFTEPATRRIERAGLLVQGEAETRAWRHFADRIEAITPYTVASTIGVNVANNLTFALMAHFDPETLNWSDKPIINPPASEPLPISVPPWWRVGKKNGMFYQGQGRGDHARFMITAALLCVNSIEEVKEADQYAPDIRAYLESLKPPVFPFEINDELALDGKTVFEQTCSGCHGTYGDAPDYPNLIVPLNIVGSDPALAIQAAEEHQRFDQWFEQSYYGTETDTVPALGYMAPPLDGVWATAPYLHNGSVPGISELLDSSERPAFWSHNDDRTYDPDNLGWTYTEHDTGKHPDKDVDANRRIYDTSLNGYGNGGHRFGDGLSTPDRLAVIEYLKTL